jgi:hypothetical protein
MAPLERNERTEMSDTEIPTVAPRAVAVLRNYAVNAEVSIGHHMA